VRSHLTAVDRDDLGMRHELTVMRDGTPSKVDGRDVAGALGLTGTPAADDPDWQQAAETYVDRHPRPEGRIADAQRLQLLRTLAAGPATTTQLLAAMREVGWVGSSDLENRLRDLRGGGKRAAGRQVTVEVITNGDVHSLAGPLPALTQGQLRALGFVKSVVAQQPTPLAAQGLHALEGMLPGVGMHTGQRVTPTMTLSADDMHRFEDARVSRTPVVVTYFSMNSGREATYRLVPVEYVPVGPAMKAVCIDVDDAGLPGAERQFALDRIRAVVPTGMPALEPEQTELWRETLHIEVTDPLYRIMAARNQFDIGSAAAEQVDLDRWQVVGQFPVALGWDVMEQMCAWAGSVIVHRPLWLVNAVTRRLRAGLRAMEEAQMELVKPDPGRVFADLEEAVYDDSPTPPPPSGARKLPRPG
jgi:predicted DNA-binding transcriptional regulator YafY